MTYQKNAICYCVNHKGQKIKPYKSRQAPPKKLNLIKRMIKAIIK
tara:strand:+ start:3593 stop:3727 length:135 start_codon:yes stop_codon:yes gene_type:complete